MNAGVTTWWDVPVVGWSDSGSSPQKRGRTTRQALLVEAARVFDERGYDAASLSDILAASGRTKGALYFHFRSKQHLATVLMDETVESWDVVRSMIAERGLDPLRTLLVETDAYVGRWTHDVVVRGGSRAMGGAAEFADRQRAVVPRLGALDGRPPAIRARAASAAPRDRSGPGGQARRRGVLRSPLVRRDDPRLRPPTSSA